MPCTIYPKTEHDRPYQISCFTPGTLKLADYRNTQYECLVNIYVITTPIPCLCSFPDKKTNWHRQLTLTTCIAWSIHRIPLCSLVLLAHKEWIGVPGQPADNPSCRALFLDTSPLLLCHAADHSADNVMDYSRSTHWFCCRGSDSYFGRLLACRGLKRMLSTCKVFLLFCVNSLRFEWKSRYICKSALYSAKKFCLFTSNRTLSVWDSQGPWRFKFRPRAISICWSPRYVLPSLYYFPCSAITYLQARLEAQTICKNYFWSIHFGFKILIQAKRIQFAAHSLFISFADSANIL